MYANHTIRIDADTTARWLVFAVGNRSRGDDALGPLLLEQLQHREIDQSDVEFLDDFQLQVEHALDLQSRYGVLFVDAALPGIVESVNLVRIFASEGVSPASHALRAEEVLSVATKLHGNAPPSWQLAIEGESFGLGDGLSETAERRLLLACNMASQWLVDRRRELACADSCESLQTVGASNHA